MQQRSIIAIQLHANSFAPMDARERSRSRHRRITDTRLVVLELLHSSDEALSQSDVERALPDQADRVTLFTYCKPLKRPVSLTMVMDAHGVAPQAGCEYPMRADGSALGD